MFSVHLAKFSSTKRENKPRQVIDVKKISPSCQSNCTSPDFRNFATDAKTHWNLKSKVCIMQVPIFSILFYFRIANVFIVPITINQTRIFLSSIYFNIIHYHSRFPPHHIRGVRWIFSLRGLENFLINTL